MGIQILAIKEARETLKNRDTSNVKAIIASSYGADIEDIPTSNKLVLQFDDVTKESRTSFNANLAKEINQFMQNIDFDKQQIYICCDSGVSRSSAIAAAILRKQKQNEDVIWENCRYRPNLFVYQKLCEEFGLKNTKWSLRKKEKVNIRALKQQIEKARKVNSRVLSKI